MSNIQLPVYEPDDLIVDMHLLADQAQSIGSGNSKQTIKKIVDVIGVCFTLPTLFTKDVFLKALGRMVTSPSPIPLIFARTVSLLTTLRSLFPLL